jgi:hypothetical protein
LGFGVWGVPSLRPGLVYPPRSGERLVCYCRTTSASTAPCTSRRMCCPTHCASHCAPCQPLLRALSGWIRSLPLTRSGDDLGFGVWGSGLSSPKSSKESLRVSVFGMIVSCFGMCVSGSCYGVRVPCFVFQDSVVRICVSCFGIQVSGFVFRLSGFGFRVSRFVFRDSCFGIRVSGFAFHISGFVFRGQDVPPPRPISTRLGVSGFIFRGWDAPSARPSSARRVSRGTPPRL